ncbi:MAG: hypothetical protein HY579_00145 [Nitrospinae bacterium]|nr:hypothetical protein [Nitrospinota bacterium]
MTSNIVSHFGNHSVTKIMPPGLDESVIPLISFSLPVDQGFFAKGGGSLVSDRTVRIPDPAGLPKNCYGALVEDRTMAPVLLPGMIGVFCSQSEGITAIQNIHAIGLRKGLPVIRKIVKHEKPAGARRKSFMTPTPLHIPGSLVSPIAESAHQMVFLKKLDEVDGPIAIPAKDIAWTHPLVRVISLM